MSNTTTAQVVPAVTSADLAALRARLSGDPADRPAWSDDVACPRCGADDACPQWCVDVETRVAGRAIGWAAFEREDGEWEQVTPLFASRKEVEAALASYGVSMPYGVDSKWERIQQVFTDEDDESECPVCGEWFDNGNHVTIGAMTTCYGVSPSQVV